MRALPISIYESKDIGNCSNGGISSKFDSVLLICDEGFIEIDEDNPPENLVKLVVKRYSFGERMHLEPVKSTDPGHVGWMSGGAYAACSDSRFRRISEYPLPIHDRQESQDLYDRLSR